MRTVAGGGCGMPIVDAFIEALRRLEQARDVEPLVSLFGSDATLETPNVHPAHAMDPTRFWREYRDSFDAIDTTFRDVAVQGRRAMLEWTSEGTLSDGSEFRYGGVTVLELEGDTIRAMRAYFDPRPLHATHAAQAAPAATKRSQGNGLPDGGDFPKGIP